MARAYLRIDKNLDEFGKKKEKKKKNLEEFIKISNKEEKYDWAHSRTMKELDQNRREMAA